MLPENVMILAGSATLIAKIGVDLLRMAAPKGYELAPWASPALAVVFGIVACLLLMLASGTAFTSQTVATALLAGVFAGAAAVGATELQRRAT